MKTSHTELSASEWDFRPLFHSHPRRDEWWELRAATAYEYGRESKAVRRLAKKYAAVAAEEGPWGRALFSKPPAMSALSNFMILPFWPMVLCPDVFPNTPWLDIPSEQRKGRVQEYARANEEYMFQVKGIEELNNLMDWELPHSPAKGERRFVSKNEHILLCLNWAFSNDELIEAFGHWVRHSRPQHFTQPRTGASRGNVEQARLARLGTMRLLHAYPYEKAAAMAGQAGIAFPSASNALKARYRVKRDIEAIYQTATFVRQKCKPPVPAGEIPIRWKTFAERQK